MAHDEHSAPPGADDRGSGGVVGGGDGQLRGVLPRGTYGLVPRPLRRCKPPGGFDSRPPSLPGLLAHSGPRSRGRFTAAPDEKPVESRDGDESGPKEHRPTLRLLSASSGPTESLQAVHRGATRASGLARAYARAPTPAKIPPVTRVQYWGGQRAPGAEGIRGIGLPAGSRWLAFVVVERRLRRNATRHVTSWSERDRWGSRWCENFGGGGNPFELSPAAAAVRRPSERR
jgi:hypothetical protein